MSGTVTGDGVNAAEFLVRYYDLGIPIKQCWYDSAYSIDAPALIVAGSCVRDEFGPGPEDWMPRESWVERP